MHSDLTIVDAHVFADGGSTLVRVQAGDGPMHIHLDYSLPWDGRLRHITVVKNSMERILAIGSSEEREICQAIYAAIERDFGIEAVPSALRLLDELDNETDRANQSDIAEASANSRVPPELAPFISPKGAAILFIKRAIKEGKFSLTSAS